MASNQPRTESEPGPEGEGRDFSSSVAWDTTTTTEPPSAYSTTPTIPSMTTTTTTTTTTTKGVVDSIRVLDGKVELEGTSDMFVSYLVTATTTGPTTDSLFTSRQPSSRRRYQDFVFLRTALVKDFQACVVPPLPDKHRMEYVVGDRFSPEFIERRRIDLSRFLTRLSKHPKLSRTSLFQNFLESTEWNVYKHKHQAQSSHSSTLSSSGASTSSTDDASSSSHHGGGGGGILDNLSDTLLNAFTKLKKPDPRFTSIRHSLDSFEEGITSIERSSTRSKARLIDLSNDYGDLSSSVQGLGFLESGITEPLMRFERSLNDFSNDLRTNSNEGGQEFVEHLHALLGYSQSFKGVLKLRDQKQLDFEELSTYLSNVVLERDRLVGGYGYGMGLTSYFKEKLEGLKGGETDLSKAARLKRLDEKIKELQEAVLASQHTSAAFNQAVLEEHETFNEIKRWEMKKLLGEYAQGQIEFQKRVLSSWDKTIPFIKRIHVEP